MRGTGLVIMIVGVGNDGVQTVVAAGHLQDDEDAWSPCRWRFAWRESAASACRAEKVLARKAGTVQVRRAAENAGAEKFAAGVEVQVHSS